MFTSTSFCLFNKFRDFLNLSIKSTVFKICNNQHTHGITFTSLSCIHKETSRCKNGEFSFYYYKRKKKLLLQGSLNRQCDFYTSLVHPSVKFTATVPYFLHSTGFSLYSSVHTQFTQAFCGCTENAKILHVRKLNSLEISQSFLQRIQINVC